MKFAIALALVAVCSAQNLRKKVDPNAWVPHNSTMSYVSINEGFPNQQNGGFKQGGAVIQESTSPETKTIYFEQWLQIPTQALKDHDEIVQYAQVRDWGTQPIDDYHGPKEFLDIRCSCKKVGGNYMDWDCGRKKSSCSKQLYLQKNIQNPDDFVGLDNTCFTNLWEGQENTNVLLYSIFEGSGYMQCLGSRPFAKDNERLEDGSKAFFRTGYYAFANGTTPLSGYSTYVVATMTDSAVTVGATTAAAIALLSSFVY